MLVSIVIPLYNKEKYIERTIQSALKQNYNNTEIIVINDGSTDRGALLIEKLLCPKIKLVHTANGGVSRARNIGARLASGNWLVFLDADDEIDPDFILKAVNFIKLHPAVDLVLVGANYYVGNRSVVAVPSTISTGIYCYFDLFFKPRAPSHISTTLVLRKALIDAGGFPEGVRHFEEWTTWFKLALKGSFGFINEPLGIYHLLPDTASAMPRDLTILYHDALHLMAAARYSASNTQWSKTRQNAALSCASEFAVHVARALARGGHKLLSLRMLRYIRINALLQGRPGPWQTYLLHLCIPQWMKPHKSKVHS